MCKKTFLVLMVLLCWGVVSVSAVAGDLTAGMKTGTVELQSIGPLAFGPDGILFISDPKAAAIYAIQTKVGKSSSPDREIHVKEVGAKIAASLGTTADKILIHDMAVNPDAGLGAYKVYLSASDGRGPDAAPVLFGMMRSGEIHPIDLKKVRFSKTELPNPPEFRQSRRGDPRLLSITDMAYVEGRVFIAGLSNEEFASNLRSIRFPFAKMDNGTSIEIFHGAHGKFETRSPVRTFANYRIGDEAYLLAAYTCTPLVKIPINQLEAGKKIVGTTIAELGNRNRPLDMFVYRKDGKDFILMANSSRGMMKITTDNIDKINGITEKISGTAGLSYDTLEGLDSVLQLDRLDENHALILVKSQKGSLDIETIPLP